MSADDDLADRSLRVVVAGASGFVGRAYAAHARACDTVIGLSRRPPAGETPGGPQQWRAADLFSLLDCERALEGADVAVYLVHSMLPSARLTQGHFADLDLIMADNFARAAAKAGVRRIVYLGGLLPRGGDEAPEILSEHLRSRLEVEQVLAAHGVPLVGLRAGIVVGARGSSFEILRALTRRLPLMALPSWTRTRTQPIALDDVVHLLHHGVHAGGVEGVHDVGGPDVLTYEEMLLDVAEMQGFHTRTIKVPLLTPGLSKAWVSMVSGQSRALVHPLVESLRHEMVARNRSFQLATGIQGRPWKEAAKLALTNELTAPSAFGSDPTRRIEPSVRSVQRLPRPPAMDAPQLADDYARWLPRRMWPLLVVDTEGDEVRFRARMLREPLLVLELSRGRSSPDRALFYVTGGLLAQEGEPLGRFEFRLSPDGKSVLTAIHGFRPRLPWHLYRYSQAIAHLWVMHSFGRHLDRKALRQTAAPAALPSAPSTEPLGKHEGTP